MMMSKTAHVRDMEAVRQFHREIRPLYDTRDPVFARSLRELVEVHEYSDDDIAVMLGVSRESIRQKRGRLGIEKQRLGSGVFRRFDWVEGRFRAMGSYEKQRYFCARRVGRRRVAKQERRTEVVQWMRLFAEERGRAPVIREIVKHMGATHDMGLYVWLGYRPGEKNCPRAHDVMAALYAEAGLDVRPRGGQGHTGGPRRGLPLDERRVWARRVREARKALGLSQAALARNVGCSGHTVYTIEAARTSPMGLAGQRVLDYLGLDDNPNELNHHERER